MRYDAEKEISGGAAECLSAKVTEGKLFVVSTLSLDQPKTKVLAQGLGAIRVGE